MWGPALFVEGAGPSLCLGMALEGATATGKRIANYVFRGRRISLVITFKHGGVFQTNHCYRSMHGDMTRSKKLSYKMIN